MMKKNGDIIAEPAEDYESLRKQYIALRTLANSKSRQVTHWRNQCGIETRETLLANSANVNAERDTNQMLTDSLLAAEQDRDELKAENEALRKDSACVDDLSALVRQLVHRLRKAAPDSDLPEKAMDYLKRKSLQGSPLRSDRDEKIELAAQAIYESWADHPEYVPWVSSGNSLKQDEARRLARESLSKEP